MKGGFTVDTSKFEKALHEVLLRTSRDMPKVINGAAIEIITEAAKLTKKADKGLIELKLTTGTVTVSSRAISGSALTASKALRNPKTYFTPAPMVYKILNAKQSAAGMAGLNNSAMSKAAQALIKKRKAAVGFTAYAGWQKALLAFGGRGFGSKIGKGKLENSSAASGYGIPAREGRRMFAKMVNTAAASEIYGKIPLQEAVNRKTAAFLKHLEEKLSEHCKHASRR